MSISSVANHNTLKEDIVTAINVKFEQLNRKYANGIITAFDKLYFLLLVRYYKFIVGEDVYEAHDSTLDTYIEGNFVTDSGNYYLCIKDVDSIGIVISNTEYWTPYISFTYSYDNITEALNKINRICGTNLEI
ncbi:hypothetical protein LCGC14_1788710 [marine sediment metagenome]|uniref:Uncharacterized protein n=1 Tax=marine sediment metagenome TaxID=412755 RepID=A0A0F9J824_9ZZZZ